MVLSRRIHDWRNSPMSTDTAPSNTVPKALQERAADALERFMENKQEQARKEEVKARDNAVGLCRRLLWELLSVKVEPDDFDEEGSVFIDGLQFFAAANTTFAPDAGLYVLRPCATCDKLAAV